MFFIDEAVVCLITVEDVDCDRTFGSKANHAVVIGSGSMEGGEPTIFIKDSNRDKTSSAHSIDELGPPHDEGNKRSDLAEKKWDGAMQCVIPQLVVQTVEQGLINHKLIY